MLLSLARLSETAAKELRLRFACERLLVGPRRSEFDITASATTALRSRSKAGVICLLVLYPGNRLDFVKRGDACYTVLGITSAAPEPSPSAIFFALLDADFGQFRSAYFNFFAALAFSSPV